MKKAKVFLAANLFLFLLIQNIYSQKDGFGMGIIAGEPTGISAKYWIGQTNAIDIGLGYSFIPKKNKISFHADYLYNFRDFTFSNTKLSSFYGFGLRYRLIKSSENSFGVRGVIGANWSLEDAPIELFIEMAPVFRLFPSTSLELDAGLGIRFYFN